MAKNKDIKVGTLSPEEKKQQKQLHKYSLEVDIARTRRVMAHAKLWGGLRTAYHLSLETEYFIDDSGNLFEIVV
jgi:hypothetical protein